MKRMVSITIIFILVLSSITLAKNIWDSRRKIANLNEIREEEKSLKVENEKLEEELKRSKSKSFIEESARNKLGLSKSGETLYVVDSRETGEVSDESISGVPTSNFRGWINIFFD